MSSPLRVLGAAITVAALLAVAPVGRAVARAGVQVDWVRRYSSGNDPEFAFANAVAADDSGNVYVTGSSYGPNGLPDFATVKYSSSGDVLWVQRYNGPDNNWDGATELTLDASGNAYVSGHSYGANSFDYLTIKYSSSGTQEWVASYDGPGHGDDWPAALVVDASGNVYVTGYSGGVGTFYDYATVKYDPSGNQQWVARYNGPGNTLDRARALGVDGSGNVYVTGDSGEGSPNLSDYLTVKYDASGTQQWAARYSVFYDYPTALALDGSGNIYVTGYSAGSGTSYDYATVKYNPRGQRRWIARYDGGIDDLAYAIAVDAARNVYVTGESGAVDKGSDYLTVKYDDRGVPVWTARYNGPGNATDVAVALGIDGSGATYVTGSSAGSGTETDYATVKYTEAGTQEWVARYNGPRNTFDDASALAVDGSGNVYVTGRSSRVGGSFYTTIKYLQI